MNRPPNPATGSEAGDPTQSSASPPQWSRFQLLESVGRGSFGEVYRAWDPDLQREVALKILLPRASQSETPFDEVLREARALAAVRHPNILPVYGVDQHDGRVGFWTDFVHGRTLAALVREQGPFGYREAALIVLDVSRALGAVHRAGLLHRDIKAENVMRESGGRILLMDFGLTAFSGRPLQLAGTPRYMAPELLRGDPATVATDVYAVGVLLFYLVTGQYPGQSADASRPGADRPGSDSPTATHAAPHAIAPAPVASSVLDHRPDLPHAFVRIVETAMHSDPRKRFASAGALSSALAETLEAPSLAASSPRRATAKRRLAWSALALVLLVSALGFYLGRAGKLPWQHPHVATENVPASLNDQFLKADALLARYDIHKNVTDAIAILNNIVAQNPSFALAEAGLGRAWFLEYRVTRAPGLLDQARAACNRAIALDGSLAQPYTTLARIDAMAGHTDLAMQEVQTALHLDPRSPEAYGAQSEVFDAQGRTADAIAAVQKAMDLQPDYWRWPLLLGNYDYAAGKLDDALTQYRKSAAIAPDSPIALLNLGLASLELGKYADSQAYLEKSVQIEPSFKAYSTLAELFTTEGKYENAIDMSKKALALDPTDYIAWGNLAATYLWIPADHEKAVETYKKAIDLAEAARKETPQDPILLAGLGGYYAFVGRTNQSLALLRQAVTLAPDDPTVLYFAGDGYEVLHRRDEAIPLIVRAIALGFHRNQLQNSPELASLRADARFQKALQTALARH